MSIKDSHESLEIATKRELSIVLRDGKRLQFEMSQAKTIEDFERCRHSYTVFLQNFYNGLCVQYDIPWKV